MKLAVSLLFALLSSTALAQTSKTILTCGNLASTTAKTRTTFDIHLTYDSFYNVYSNVVMMYLLKTIDQDGIATIVDWSIEDSFDGAMKQLTLTFVSGSDSEFKFTLPTNEIGIVLKRTNAMVDRFEITVSGIIQGKDISDVYNCVDKLSIVQN